MKIYLLNNHEAVVVNDHKDTVITEPAVGGTLTVEGMRRAIASEQTLAPVYPELRGHVRASFTNEGGIRYKIIRPRVDNGVLYSAVDYVNGYMELRLLIDRQAREIERLTRELLDLRGQIEPDALGHMNIGGENHE